MRAGSMRTRLSVRPLTKTVDQYGAEQTVYPETRIIHAERVRLTGRRSEEVSEHFPDYSAQYRVRDAHRISENWRVKELGGHLYTVVAVEPCPELGMSTLICERVNE